MPKTKEQKQQVVTELIDKLKQAKSMVLSDYAGLPVVETEDLRKKCKSEGVEFYAIKKTLLKKALTEAGIENLDKIDFTGSLAIAFAEKDEIAPAKVIDEFAKKHESVQFKGGIFEGQVIAIDQVMALAKIPSRLELYAKMVGSLNAPISGFVNVLAGNLRGLVNVLNAIKETK